jgi:hypothetical protein
MHKKTYHASDSPKKSQRLQPKSKYNKHGREKLRRKYKDVASSFVKMGGGLKKLICRLWANMPAVDK